MGNQGKMEIRRFVLEFKASYFFLNSYIWSFPFEKSNLQVQRNNALNLECKGGGGTRDEPRRTTEGEARAAAKETTLLKGN